MDYEIALEYAESLEAVKELNLKGTPAVEVLAGYVYKHGYNHGEDLNDLIRSLAVSIPRDKESVLLAELTPDDRVTSAFLAGKIAPWIRMLREEIFGAPEAPFATIGEADRWLEQERWRESDIPWLDWKEHEKEYLHIAKAYRKRGFVFPPIDGAQIYTQIYPLLHPKDDDFIKCVPVNPPSGSFLAYHLHHHNYSAPLLWMAAEIEGMAKATGFNQTSLFAYILTGIEPILPRWQLHTKIQVQPLHSGEQLSFVSVNLEIKAKDLSFEELQEVYRHIREQLKVKKTKPLNVNHLALYKMVQEKGGQPRKGTVKFWESVREELNKRRRPNQRYDTWKGVKITYDRIIDKLETAYAGKGESRTILEKEANHERPHPQTK